MAILSFFIFIISLIFGFIIWNNIFSKAGYNNPGLRAFLMLIPIVNFIIFLQFAFGEWPISKKKNVDFIRKGENLSEEDERGKIFPSGLGTK